MGMARLDEPIRVFGSILLNMILKETKRHSVYHASFYSDDLSNK